ncbi:MAG: hypothetical protein R2883_00505 [Caldisericia bacterium]
MPESAHTETGFPTRSGETDTIGKSSRILFISKSLLNVLPSIQISIAYVPTLSGFFIPTDTGKNIVKFKRSSISAGVMNVISEISESICTSETGKSFTVTSPSAISDGRTISSGNLIRTSDSVAVSSSSLMSIVISALRLLFVVPMLSHKSVSPAE